jgi:hypothetical protein
MTSLSCFLLPELMLAELTEQSVLCSGTWCSFACMMQTLSSSANPSIVSLRLVLALSASNLSDNIVQMLDLTTY